jgi:hypothetical protein
MGACTDRTRYSVTSQTNGQFNLNINNTVISDAGTFVCNDLASNTAAAAVYGVMDSEPNVTSSTSQSCLYEGDQVVLTCRATYNGSNAMPLSMTWTTSSGQLVNSNMTNDTATGLFQSTVYITAEASDIPVHLCHVTFHAPTSETVPPGVDPFPIQATNVPTYSSVGTSSAYTVQYCPRTISVIVSKVALSNGSVETIATCSVEGGNSSITTTYTWTSGTNRDVFSNSSRVTIQVGDYWYNLTCTARSTVSCGVGSNQTCADLCKTISGTPTPTPTPTAPEVEIGPKSCVDNLGCVLPVVLVSILGVLATVIIVTHIKYSGNTGGVLFSGASVRRTCPDVDL